MIWGWLIQNWRISVMVLLLGMSFYAGCVVTAGRYAAKILKIEQANSAALEVQAKENAKQLEKASAESLKRQKTIRFLSKELRKSHAKNPTAKCPFTTDELPIIKSAIEERPKTKHPMR